jgi:hypothetical protein
MLRPFVFKHDNLHGIQSFVNHIVLEVLCQAPKLPNKTFSISLVHPKYHDLIRNVNKEYLLFPLTRAYKLCKQLEPRQIKVLRRALHQNNRIRELCAGQLKPVSYSELRKIDKNLATHLRTLCDNLYNKVIDLAPASNQFGSVDTYYKNLVKRSATCASCGIHKVLTQFNSKRSAFDHYLAKSIYPFCSVNFHNLVPICDNCNGKFKTAKDVLHKPQGKGRKPLRVKAFYPYRRSTPDIKVQVEFKKAYTASILPEDVSVELSCVASDEELSTWERIFGIKENYIEFCCTSDMYGYYEEHYLAVTTKGITHREYIETLEKIRFNEGNLLRIAILEALA